MKRHILPIIIVIISILFFWQNIIFHINTSLRGWYDELLIIWIYQNNVQHFTSLDFKNIYETNAVYPFTNTLSFAEQLYFPSFFILFFNLFTKNILLQYNLLSILNHLLIFACSLLFFKKLFKNSSAALISALYAAFSPYFFNKMGLFQMLFFWPTFLSLFFLTDYFESKKNKSLFLSAVFTGFQFLSSVYLGIMNLTIILFWAFSHTNFSKKILSAIFQKSLIFLLTFLVIAGVSIYGYILVNKEYHAKRDYSEYVTYSASMTDYIFPVDWQNSLIYSSKIFNKLKNLNHHEIGESAAFAGIIPLFFAIYLLFPSIKKIKDNTHINFTVSKTTTFALLLITAGFFLSLGPRLFVNGQYTQLPLPFDLFLKTFPPVGIIRVVARWHFLVIMGFSVLLGLGYIKLQEKICKNSPLKSKVLFAAIFLLVFLEFYSFTPVAAYSQKWNDEPYQFLAGNICKNPGATLLEYPFHYRNLDGNIGLDVNYMAKILLNSTQHKCKILSGYYSYEPPAYLQIKKEFEDGFSQSDVSLIKRLGINYMKFNKYAISDIEYQKILQAKTLEQFQNIYDDNQVTIYKINYETTK